ncbi:MAG: acetoin utilization protein AcuC [Candidatus Eisenbacteria bacterium]|nr:acetoin utilization protein AcuC [Candidatus Eisenbacteria bacterium]
MRQGFVFRQDSLRFSYGPYHLFQIERLADVARMCRALGLLPVNDSPMTFDEASRADLQLFHDPDYLEALEAGDSLSPHEQLRWGLGTGDNPVFDGLWESCLLTAGGSLRAARWLLDGAASGDRRRVFHPAGGLHHAHKARASGFCYINDGVLAIKEIVDAGLKVCYIDVDAHHGDGVQEAFYDSERVLTLSIHQDGRTLYPGTGFVEEVGEGRGRGYAVNIPVLPGSGDAVYDYFIEEIATPVLAKFSPDILVTEMGVDSLRGDPLTELEWSLGGLDRFLTWVVSTGLPWLALGGGGYNRWNVIRGWTLVWARMLGRELPESRPEEDEEGRLPVGWPRDFWVEEGSEGGANPETCLLQVRRVRAAVEDLVMPWIGR